MSEPNISHSFCVQKSDMKISKRLTASSWLVRSTRFCRHLAAANLLRSRRIRRRSSSSGVNWKQLTISQQTPADIRSGNALVSINEVNQHRARLVLGWVTASGFNSRGCHFISVCNQPPRLTQPPTLGGTVNGVPAKGRWCSVSGE